MDPAPERKGRQHSARFPILPLPISQRSEHTASWRYTHANRSRTLLNGRDENISAR
jgi:hypothetical protein